MRCRHRLLNTPTIFIYQDRIEVWATRIRHVKLLQRSCRSAIPLAPYICEKSDEVLEKLLEVLKRQGFESVRICNGSGKCREVKL